MSMLPMHVPYSGLAKKNKMVKGQKKIKTQESSPKISELNWSDEVDTALPAQEVLVKEVTDPKQLEILSKECGVEGTIPLTKEIKEMFELHDTLTDTMNNFNDLITRAEKIQSVAAQREEEKEKIQQSTVELVGQQIRQVQPVLNERADRSVIIGHFYVSKNQLYKKTSTFAMDIHHNNRSIVHDLDQYADHWLGMLFVTFGECYQVLLGRGEGVTAANDHYYEISMSYKSSTRTLYINNVVLYETFLQILKNTTFDPAEIMVGGRIDLLKCPHGVKEVSNIEMLSVVGTVIQDFIWNREVTPRLPVAPTKVLNSCHMGLDVIFNNANEMQGLIGLASNSFLSLHFNILPGDVIWTLTRVMLDLGWDVPALEHYQPICTTIIDHSTGKKGILLSNDVIPLSISVSAIFKFDEKWKRFSLSKKTISTLLEGSKKDILRDMDGILTNFYITNIFAENSEHAPLRCVIQLYGRMKNGIIHDVFLGMESFNRQVVSNSDVLDVKFLSFALLGCADPNKKRSIRPEFPGIGSGTLNGGIYTLFFCNMAQLLFSRSSYDNIVLLNTRPMQYNVSFSEINIFEAGRITAYLKLLADRYHLSIQQLINQVTDIQLTNLLFFLCPVLYLFLPKESEAVCHRKLMGRVISTFSEEAYQSGDSENCFMFRFQGYCGCSSHGTTIDLHCSACISQIVREKHQSKVIRDDKSPAVNDNEFIKVTNFFPIMNGRDECFKCGRQWFMKIGAHFCSITCKLNNTTIPGLSSQSIDQTEMPAETENEVIIKPIFIEDSIGKTNDSHVEKVDSPPSIISQEDISTPIVETDSVNEIDGNASLEDIQINEWLEVNKFYSLSTNKQETLLYTFISDTFSYKDSSKLSMVEKLNNKLISFFSIQEGKGKKNKKTKFNKIINNLTMITLIINWIQKLSSFERVDEIIELFTLGNDLITNQISCWMNVGAYLISANPYLKQILMSNSQIGKILGPCAFYHEMNITGLSPNDYHIRTKIENDQFLLFYKNKLIFIEKNQDQVDSFSDILKEIVEFFSHSTKINELINIFTHINSSLEDKLQSHIELINMIKKVYSVVGDCVTLYHYVHTCLDKIIS